MSSPNSAMPAAGDILLVCVSPAPASGRVIRVAAETARVRQSAFIALHVDARGDLGIPAGDRDRLREHFALVTRLGGRVVTVQGANIAAEVVAYAERHGITEIFVGKNALRAKRRWAARKADTVGAILRMGPYLDVHVVPGVPADYTVRSRPRIAGIRLGNRHRRRIVVGSIRAATILAVALLIGQLFDRMGFTEANTIMVIILAVLVISALEGRVIGLTTSIAAVALFNLLFTEPRFRLVVDDSQYVITFVVMLAVSFFAGELTARIRRAADIARLRERHTEMLYRTTQSLLHVRGVQALAAVASEHLGRLLGRTVVCLLPNDDGTWNTIGAHGTSDMIHMDDRTERDAVRRCYEKSVPTGWSTAVCPDAQRFYHPINIQGSTLGIVGVVASDQTLEHSDYSLIEVIVAQLAMALDRERLALAEEESRIAAEHERLRGNLLRSISHDFRTPLAAIIGSSSMLLEQQVANGRESVHLIEGIRDDAAWLASLVENLLSLTRLEADIRLQQDWEVVDDLILSAVERWRKRGNAARIRVDLPDSASLVYVDPGLIEQVLLNLIDNALRHAPAPANVFVSARVENGDAVLEVRDEGPGFTDDALKHAFDHFYTGASIPDSRRGLGLGLAICKSIIDAHGGSIDARNSTDGGAILRFTLPECKPLPNGRADDEEGDETQCRTNR